jgi:hypothetical protein
LADYQTECKTMLFRILKLIKKRKSRTIKLAKGQSYHAPDLSLVISCGGVWYVPNPKGADFKDAKPEYTDLVIGAPGLQNIKREMQLGDAVLYQMPDYGVVEVRVVRFHYGSVSLLITEVSPRRGFTAAYDSDEQENTSFGTDETTKISKGLANVATRMANRLDVTPQQCELLRAKLDEIADASTRIGRKDWIMFAAGTLTNVVVGAAFSPEAAKALFTALNDELSWVFQNALRLAGS